MIGPRNPTFVSLVILAHGIGFPNNLDNPCGSTAGKTPFVIGYQESFAYMISVSRVYGSGSPPQVNVSLSPASFRDIVPKIPSKNFLKDTFCPRLLPSKARSPQLRSKT